MTYEEAKIIFLMEYCGERCNGSPEDTDCRYCEINKAIEALEVVMRVKTVITELEEMRYYHAAQIVRKAVGNEKEVLLQL